MQQQTIHDKSGVWLINTAGFPFVDPESGCRFEPRVPTKAKETAWVRGQAVIQKWVDPDELVEPKPAKAAK
jgi:hypothetical protein